MREFTHNPSEWLNGSSMTVKKVSIDAGVISDYAPISRSNGARWFNVLTFGDVRRCTQLAFYGYVDTSAGSQHLNHKIWMRTQHDLTVSDWVEK